MSNKVRIPHDVIFSRSLSWQAKGVIFLSIAQGVAITEDFIRGYANGVKTSTGYRPIGRDLAKALINEIVAAGFGAYAPGGAVYLKDRISPELRKAVFSRDGHRCIECGSSKRLCADHIVPESKGGQATLDNLQTLCRPCNSEKGARS